MRKVILALAMVLILPVVFQSCKNDDNNEFSLVGTEWVAKYTNEGIFVETHLKFINETQVQTFYFDENGQQSEEPEDAIYVVSGSKIVLTYADKTIYSGTINGNKMTFIYEEDEASYQFVFEKM